MAETSKNKIYYNNDENSIANILADMKKLAESADNAIETKVDKDSGKKLSTNDFTNEYKNKLDELNNYDDTKIKEELEEVKEENTRLKEDLNALPTVQGNGEYVTLDTAECRFKNFSVEGKSEQETTEGYNLCNIPNQTINGVTIINSNNGLILNGTCSSTFSIVALKQKVEAGDYIIKKLGDGASNATYQSVIYKNNNIVAYVAKANKSITFENDDEIRLQLYIYSGTVFNNLILPVQVCKDNDRPYEPYTGGIASPNPDYPQEIETVGDNINIFNKNINVTTTYLNKTVLDTGVRITQTQAGNYKCLPFKIGEDNLLGKKLALSTKMQASANNQPRAVLYFGSPTSTAVRQIGSEQITSGSTIINIPSSFPDGCDRIYLLLYSNKDGTGNAGDYVDYTDLKLEVGDRPTPYSDYNCGNIPIKIQNESLFDIGELVKLSADYSEVENGYTFNFNMDMYNTGVAVTVPIELPASISYTIKNGTGTNFRLKFWFDDGTVMSLNDYKSGTNTEERDFVINNFTKRGASKIIRIGFDRANMGTFTLTNFMINEGTTVKSYIEHKEQNISFNLDKPLYQNCYLAEDGIHYTKKQIVLDGSEDENWSLSATNTSNQNRFTSKIIKNEVKRPSNADEIANIICSHFIKESANETYRRSDGIAIHSNGSICLYYDMFKEYTINEFKTWLSNNPITLEYELATEIIEPYTEEQKQQWEQLKNARSYEGQTHILSTDEISPNFNITARANLSEILNKLQGE